MTTHHRRAALLLVALSLLVALRGRRPALAPSSPPACATPCAVVDELGRLVLRCDGHGAALPAPARLVLGLPLDLNRAAAAELEALPRIGPRLAQRIVAERERGGPFASTTALRRVRGIGPALLRRLSGLVTTGGAGDDRDGGAPP